MTDKEKADCLIELHKGQLEHYKDTRTIEFKVNLTFWSFIILAGYYVKKEIVFNPWVNTWHLIIYVLCSLIVILVYLFFWIKPIQKSEDMDDFFVNEYRSEVEKLTDIKIKPYNKRKRNKNHWVLFMTGITAFLLIVVGIYLSLPKLGLQHTISLSFKGLDSF